MSAEPNISVRYEIEIACEVRDLWPDGDAPDGITAEAVVAMFRDYYGPKPRGRFIDDFCLTDGDVDVIVHHPRVDGEAARTESARWKRR